MNIGDEGAAVEIPLPVHPDDVPKPDTEPAPEPEPERAEPAEEPVPA